MGGPHTRNFCGYFFKQGVVIMTRVIGMRPEWLKMQAKQTCHEMGMFINIKLFVADGSSYRASVVNQHRFLTVRLMRNLVVEQKEEICL